MAESIQANDATLEMFTEAQRKAVEEAAKNRLRHYEPGDLGYGPEECNCGEDISANRRALGATRCVQCQTKHESIHGYHIQAY